MNVEAIYVIQTPKGHVSDTAAFHEGQATRRYVRQWLPAEVRVNDYVADQLWREFEKSGWKCVKIGLPDALDGKPVCLT